MKTYLLLFLLFIGYFATIAQNEDATISQFQESIQQAKTDSVKLKLKVAFSDYLYDTDVNKARSLAVEVKEILEQKDSTPYFLKLRGSALRVMAKCDVEQNKHLEALATIQSSIDIANVLKDSILLGRAFIVRGNLSKVRNDTTTAIHYFKEAENIQKKFNDSIGLADTYMHYAVLLNDYRVRKDSVPFFLNKVKQLDTTFAIRINADANMGAYYLYNKEYAKAISLYKGNIAAHKEKHRMIGLPACFMNLGVAYAFSNNKEAAFQALDSAIYYSKRLDSKGSLLSQYLSKSNMARYFGDYEIAYENYVIYKQYSDSLKNIDETKRFTEQELNYEFDKEREIAAIQLDNANTKKQLYIILFITALTLGLSIIYVVVKNKRQKVALARNETALEQMEKMKAKLALANRESELKKILVESSITEEVLNKTLDDIKEIITKHDIAQRDKELRSLSTSLLAEKSNQRAVASLQEHIDEVSVDFKVYLDKQYPMLKPKDKELLYLMKVGLSTAEISKLLKTSVASVKSKRYRIRKKLNLGSDVDIVAHLEKEMIR
ncbi:helix-turn-helix transcriptional regulator [Dokdonia ponticola]|uniref:Helix-turn-helix transcriptional regulator n=1 Tax=Dokdonia ponticola TaxID=2041041 RepID=A0ABV9HXK0_9FLAO